MEADVYPALKNLIRGYFHQEWDIDNEDPDQAIDGFQQVATPRQLADVVRDIDAFFARYDHGAADVNVAFKRVFSPEVPVLGCHPRNIRDGSYSSGRSSGQIPRTLPFTAMSKASTLKQWTPPVSPSRKRCAHH